jgi:hypothetical protein
MLYESSLKELDPGFSQYQSEAEIPPELHARWGECHCYFRPRGGMNDVTNCE